MLGINPFIYRLVRLNWSSKLLLDNELTLLEAVPALGPFPPTPEVDDEEALEPRPEVEEPWEEEEPLAPEEDTGGDEAGIREAW